MNYTSGPPEQKVVYALESELERLRAVEVAAKAVIEAVCSTHDHTQWFKPLSELQHSLSRRYPPYRGRLEQRSA